MIVLQLLHNTLPNERGNLSWPDVRGYDASIHEFRLNSGLYNCFKVYRYDTRLLRHKDSLFQTIHRRHRRKFKAVRLRGIRLLLGLRIFFLRDLSSIRDSRKKVDKRAKRAIIVRRVAVRRALQRCNKSPAPIWKRNFFVSSIIARRVTRHVNVFPLCYAFNAYALPAWKYEPVIAKERTREIEE